MLRGAPYPARFCDAWRLALLAASLVAFHASPLLAQPDCLVKSAPPAAAFDASCGSSCPYTWTFTVTSPQSGISQVEWDFGDGSPLSATGTHTYSADGYYPITLIVTMSDGQIVVATGGVTVGSASPLAFDDTFSAEVGVPLTISTQELLSNDVLDTDFSEFDDLGHYRVAKTYDNFDALAKIMPLRTETTGWNQKADGSAVARPAPAVRWILGTYGFQEQEGGGHTRQEFVFEPGTGFLQCKRVLRQWPNRDPITTAPAASRRSAIPPVCSIAALERAR
jgi:hypothetical protein